VGEHDEVMKMLKAAKISVNVCDDRHVRAANARATLALAGALGAAASPA
jgi:hypothetical protein